MEQEMYPVMQVKQTIVENEFQYEITLSRENFNHLCAGCPGLDRIAGFADDKMVFYILESKHGKMPDSFKPMSDGSGYLAYVGVPVPQLPEGVTSDEFDKLANQAYENLEKAINESGRIPIEDKIDSSKVTLGYVVMRVEKEDVS